jgi:hypothetical protein
VDREGIDFLMPAAKTLYVCRPLKNAKDLHEWATSQGFRSALPLDDMHVTIAFSRKPLDWSDIGAKRSQLETHGGRRSIEKLGDAIVLRFSSKSLESRWNDLRNAGASWDWPDYKPHVTITYQGAPDDINAVEPYRGTLIFGAERFSEVDEDADKDIEETQLASTTTSPHNVAVKYRGRSEREMPPYPKPKSQAQNAAMHAAAEGRSTLGIPKKVGAEFAKGASGTKVKGLPKHVGAAKPSRARQRARMTARKAAKRGLISDTAMAKHFGDGY